MTDTQSFQRARKPAERELRREAILAAAAALFDAEGAQGAGLNAIAARAGFTKSNVYRYFESREEVLLELLLAEFEALVPAFEAAAERCAPNDAAALARAVADSFVAQPRLGHLVGILATVLEQNVSEDTIIAVKRALSASVQRLAAALHGRLPGTTLEDCAWVASIIGTIVAGMWPGAHPSPAAARVLAREEFARFKPSLERDLERAALALLQSIIP